MLLPFFPAATGPGLWRGHHRPHGSGADRYFRARPVPALYLVHQKLPHQHFELGREGPDVSYIRGIWLFIIAITLHNFPEGMAVGVGFAGEDVRNGYILATGIGMQNIPEGLAVAFSLLAIDYSRLRAFGIALLTGLAEPIGGLFGATAVWLAEPVMPWTRALPRAPCCSSSAIRICKASREWKIMSTFSLMGGLS